MGRVLPHTVSFNATTSCLSNNPTTLNASDWLPPASWNFTQIELHGASGGNDGSNLGGAGGHVILIVPSSVFTAGPFSVILACSGRDAVSGGAGGSGYTNGFAGASSGAG